MTHIRTDVAPGLATNPTAAHQCPIEPEKPGGEGFDNGKVSTAFVPSTCEEGSIIGTNRAVIYAGPVLGDLSLEGTVYNRLCLSRSNL